MTGQRRHVRRCTCGETTWTAYGTAKIMERVQAVHKNGAPDEVTLEECESEHEYYSCDGCHGEFYPYEWRELPITDEIIETEKP